MHQDVVVVGGGPAGIATAIAASLKGLSVTVLDSRKPPIDKPCGEGLLPEAVAALSALGIELDSTLAFPFRGIRFCDQNSAASASIARGKSLRGPPHCAAPNSCRASAGARRFFPLGIASVEFRFAARERWRAIDLLQMAHRRRRPALHSAIVGASRGCSL